MRIKGAENDPVCSGLCRHWCRSSDIEAHEEERRFLLSLVVVEP